MEGRGREQVGQPGVRADNNAAQLSQVGDLAGDRKAAASGQIGLYDVDPPPVDQRVKTPDRSLLLSRRDRRGNGLRQVAITVVIVRSQRFLDPEGAVRLQRPD